MNDIARLAWRRFGIIAAAFGDLQGRAIATAFYFTVLVPFGLIVRLTSDPLHIGKAHQEPAWLPREPVDNRLDAAKRQG